MAIWGKLLFAIQKAMHNAMVEARMWGSDYANLDMYTEFKFFCWSEDQQIYCVLTGAK